MKGVCEGGRGGQVWRKVQETAGRCGAGGQVVVHVRKPWYALFGGSVTDRLALTLPCKGAQTFSGRALPERVIPAQKERFPPLALMS